MKPSDRLVQFLNENSLPWLKYNVEEQKLTLIVDNHLMGLYRECPQHFFHAAVNGLAAKSPLQVDGQARIWFLDFGVVLHKMIELYYRDFRKPDFDVNKWAFERGAAEWYKMRMDDHAEHKEYKLIGGLPGFMGLLFQFGTVFTPQNEKLRVIAQEVSFGRRGEVPLYRGEGLDIFLAGRMDLVVDDGYFIGPMDHKSMGSFRGDPGLQFETEEGPTGYIYAMSKILPSIVPEDQFLKRDCSKILMNLISKKPTDTPSDRFRRVPVRKTLQQLYEYEQRMIQTGKRMVEDMEEFVIGLPPRRNTAACTNWHMYPCKYRDICRQGSSPGIVATIKNGFIQVPLWDTEAVEATT